MGFASLTEALKVRCPEGKTDKVEWYSEEPGFGIRVLPGDGTKRFWLARYRKDGKDVKHRLLEHPVTPVKNDFLNARKAARALRDAHVRGGVQAPTIEQALKAYITAHEKLSPVTIAGYEKLGGLLADIKHMRLEQAGDTVWNAKWTSIETKHGVSTTHGLFRLVHALYAWAHDEYGTENNPISKLKRKHGLYKRRTPKQRAVPAAKMKAFWEAVHMHLHPASRDYVLWALLTCWRSSLVGHLRWDRFNMQAKTYHIDKTDIGNKAKQDFEWPVCDWLWENVVMPRYRVRHADALWVLESPKWPGTAIHAPRGAFKVIEARSGVKVSPHDLRRTFSTIADTIGVSQTQLARLLAHSIEATGKDRSMAVTLGYVVADEEALRETANRVAKAIVSLATAKPAEAMPQA